MARSKNFDFAQLNLTSFLNDLIGHAKETIHMFSKFLADEARTHLFELRDKLDVNYFLYIIFFGKKKFFILFRNMKIILNEQLIHLKI
jgi:hypothetical protein